MVSDGKPGMENQCLGLAEALHLNPVVKRIRTRLPWRWMPPQLWARPLAAIGPAGDPLTPPWPDLVIATGRQSVAPSAAIRGASKGRSFVVQVQNPTVDPARFDLVVVPRHDRLHGPNVLHTRGALHRVTATQLTAAAQRFAPTLEHLPRPLVAVLIGGSNGRYRLDPPDAARIGAQLAEMTRAHGAGLAVTPSRRTGNANQAALREALAGVPHIFWDGSGENPYFGYLALADLIVVTADSVSMTSEACSTGKPVYVVELAGGSGKFRRFHQSLRDDGITRPFTGALDRWQYTPPDDTAMVAAEVRTRMGLEAAGDRQSEPPRQVSAMR